MHVQCAFLYNLYEHDRKVPYATMFEQINFLGCGPQDSVGKFNFFCHFKSVDGNKCGKVKKKKPADFILIARDVFIALAVVVAKAPYINKSDSSIFNWFYCKLV